MARLRVRHAGRADGRRLSRVSEGDRSIRRDVCPRQYVFWRASYREDISKPARVGIAIGVSAVEIGRLDGARSLRHVWDQVRRSSGFAADLDARGVYGISVAEGLP